MADKVVEQGRGTALARRVRDRVGVDLRSLPLGEQALVAGGLMVLERAAGVIDKLDTVADIQIETARMGRCVLGMFPPLIGKLGELIDLELQAARARLGADEEEEKP